jgi:hypothetical protein
MRFVCATAIGIDARSNQLILDNGNSFNHDFLIIASHMGQIEN